MMSNDGRSIEDYYTILDCIPSATYEELKESYQKLIREHHPDKSGESQENFLKIHKAWETLRDQKLRNQYDIDLQNEKDLSNEIIFAEFKRCEIIFTENMFNYPCRCGGNYSLTEDLLECYLEESEKLFFECDGCSNSILIKK